jgi:DNA-binding response OmpR family regulator
VQRRKVLVVEDDPIQIQILVTTLRGAGYDVVVARDAVQSVPLARVERPAVVLLDIGLPGGDGYVVLKRLQALLPLAGLPVIAMSARAAETERSRMVAAGAVEYFEKPIDYRRLIERVGEICGELAP